MLYLYAALACAVGQAVFAFLCWLSYRRDWEVGASAFAMITLTLNIPTWTFYVLYFVYRAA